MVKKAETFWKGLSHNRAQISPIPSQGYGDRFINFIEEITMSKEEAERQRQARDQGSVSQERSRSSLGFRRSSVERSMQQEKELARDGLEPHSRTLMAVRDTADPPATLPVVEEAGEAGSTGSEKHPHNGGQSSEEPRDGDRERWNNSADHVDDFSYSSDAQHLAPASKKGKGRELVYGGLTIRHPR
jgi:1-phosphatidylinositol-4-phosphate 5-kinase